MYACGAIAARIPGSNIPSGSTCFLNRAKNAASTNCWPFYDFPAEHWVHLRTHQPD